MPTKQIGSIAVLALLLLLITSCEKENNNSKPPESRKYYVGIAPIPRNYPGTQADWVDMFEKIQYSGELVTAQNPWRDSKEKSGVIPEFISLMGGQKINYSYEVVYGINFFVQNGAYDPLLDVSTNLANNWSNENAKTLYRQVALDICTSYSPKYIGLAFEVNAYCLKHPSDFDLFVTFYKSLYDEIKSISPNTKVFVTFQLEMLKGIGDKTWGFSVESHWSILEKFGDKLDLAVFTSYPEVEYNSPDDIPSDYYEEIATHTNKKIAIVEVGWSSNKYSEADQGKFIARFIELVKNVDLEFANWIFMHDLPSDDPLTKTGLRKSDGTKKEAWDKWCELKELPRVDG